MRTRPKPAPLSDETRGRMQRQRQRDTKPEIELRRELHRLGLRFRVDTKAVAGSRRRVDIKFGPARVAVLVHGCFWHGCPRHATTPRNNRAWWREKIAANVERDRRTIEELKANSWTPVVVWEHEDMGEVAHRILDLVCSRRTRVSYAL